MHAQNEGVVDVGDQNTLADHMVQLFEFDDFSLFQHFYRHKLVGYLVLRQSHPPVGAGAQSGQNLVFKHFEFGKAIGVVHK